MTTHTTEDNLLRQRTPLLGYQVKPEDDDDDQTTTSLSTASTSVVSRRSIEVDAKKNSRMLDRSGGFRQSLGEWRIQRIVPDKFALYWWKDAYHTLLNSPTWRLISVLYLVYVFVVVLFAVVYLTVANFSMYVDTSAEASGSSSSDVVMEEQKTVSSCDMDITNMSEALYFSLSTMTTIGYGVSDYYFGDCWTPFAVVLLQVLFSISYNAVAIGIIFQRLSRGQNRATTVVFSDKAIIRRIRGKLYFMFQLCEQRKHQLAEAHVRLYCVRHEREHGEVQNNMNTIPQGDKEESLVDTCYFQTHSMRTQHPDDSLGAYLLMALPNVVVHRLDESSPLVPPREWTDARGERHLWEGQAYNASFPTPLRRSCDYEMGIQPTASHDSFQYGSEQEEITKFISDREAEIVVIVEGVDEITSSTIQCRHSYRYDDIVWNHTFTPCVSPHSKNKRDKNNRDRIFSITDGCKLDLGKFHQLRPAPLDCDGCPLVPNIS